MSSTISIVCSPKVENSQIIEVFGGGNIYKYCTRKTKHKEKFVGQNEKQKAKVSHCLGHYHAQ